MQSLERSTVVVLAAVMVAGAVVIVVGACGGARITADGLLLDAGKDDVAGEEDVYQPWNLDGIADAAPDLIVCPAECPNADYYITINGDGPTQTLRSNKSPGNYGYYVPIAAYLPGGEGNPATDIIRAADAPDGGTRLSIASNTCYDSRGERYCSAVIHAHADVTYTRRDPPGGFVAGSYTVSVGNGGPTGKVLSLSGKFLACRICDLPASL